MSLTVQESEYFSKKIGRIPNNIERQIVAAEWSEHCSYKSSKKHLKLLPTTGRSVINEKGFDLGVLDVGNGYVVTVHIESHNHPSAVEPYGGAATGVGGVIRDILSTGTRPIAIFDGLRFGNIENDNNAKWLFKNAVSGIADYGNCLGIPTIGGEVEFDQCYKDYALVDVAAIGFGKKDKLIKNHASNGDLVVLIGGSTGRDGIGGSQFASDSLENENRSAIQIPDPFHEIYSFCIELDSLSQADDLTTIFDEDGLDDIKDLSLEFYNDFASPIQSTVIDNENVNLSAWFDYPPNFLTLWENIALDKDSPDNSMHCLFPDESTDLECDAECYGNGEAEADECGICEGSGILDVDCVHPGRLLRCR